MGVPVLPYTAPLRRGTLLRRPNRFVVEVQLDDGETVRAHCPNPGRMTGCSTPGSPVWLLARTHTALPYRLEIVQAGSTLVGANPVHANAVVEAALRAGALRHFCELGLERREAFLPDHSSRVDFLLRDRAGRALWLEVKSVTLVEDGVALFPDAVTARGRRHLLSLAERVLAGDRAVTLYLVQRDDAHSVGPAAHIDLDYAEAFATARAAGVEMLGLRARVQPDGITIDRELPVVIV
ncbi:MAG: DNA/RNA nuclease SfsA [Pseudomonadota bacterium]